MIDYSKYIENATSSFEAQPKGPGPNYEAPPEGPCGLRFVGYIELGRFEDEYQGQKKIVEKVKLIFEVFGPKYPVKDINGEKVPVRITVSENKSMHEKSNFRKLYEQMKSADTKHIAQLLGRAFSGRVYQKKTKAGRTIATLQNPNTKAYSIGPAVFENPQTGEIQHLDVPQPVSQPKCFIWEQADKAMWDSIYIGGNFGEGRSRNVFQEEIRQGLRWNELAGRVGEGPGGQPVQDFFQEQVVLASHDDPFGDIMDPPAQAAPAANTADAAAKAYSSRFRRSQ